jgi:hypothetical protein
VSESDRLHLGKSVPFRTKPTDYQVTPARSGRVRSFNLDGNGTLFIMGETPLPDQNCVFPLLIDQDSLVDGFPVGQCAPIADGRWQLQIPMDPAGSQINFHPNTSYQVILFSNDLTIPPSEPFEIQISPLIQN